jgi:hypothetical protein
MTADERLPLWWYSAVPPEMYAQLIAQLIDYGELTSDPKVNAEREILQEREVMRLFRSVERCIEALRDRLSESWLWEVSMSYRPWSDDEREAIAHYNLPPLRYQVEVAIQPHLVDQESKSGESGEPWNRSLTPAELSLITALDSEVGRRIGDELDGQRPQTLR